MSCCVVVQKTLDVDIALGKQPFISTRFSFPSAGAGEGVGNNWNLFNG